MKDGREDINEFIVFLQNVSVQYINENISITTNKTIKKKDYGNIGQ